MCSHARLALWQTAHKALNVVVSNSLTNRIIRKNTSIGGAFIKMSLSDLPKDVLLYKIIPHLQEPLLAEIAKLKAELESTGCCGSDCAGRFVLCAVCGRRVCSHHSQTCECCLGKRYCAECIVIDERGGFEECPRCANECSRITCCNAGIKK